MEVLSFAASLALLFLLVQSGRMINRASLERYGYASVTLTTAVMAMVPYVLMISGLFLLEKDPLLGMGISVLSLPAVLCLYHHIRVRTSPVFALIPALYLMSTALFMVVVLPLMKEKNITVCNVLEE